MKITVKQLKELVSEAVKNELNKSENLTVSEQARSIKNKKRLWETIEIGGGWGSERRTGFAVASSEEEAIHSALVRFENFTPEQAQRNLAYYVAKPVSASKLEQAIGKKEEEVAAYQSRLNKFLAVKDEL